MDKTASPVLLIHGGSIWIHTLLFLLYKSRIRASSSAPAIVPLRSCADKTEGDKVV